MRYSVPADEKLYTYSVDSFQGVNFTDTPATIDSHKSPDAPNMIRDVPGKVRKCMGYYRTGEYGGRINGHHIRRGDLLGLVHAGERIYKGDTVLYEDANDHRSTSWQMGQKLYIADGKALLVYDGETVQRASDVAYIPTLTIAKSPSGGGTDYEALNLLQPKYTELFAGVANQKVYQLTFDKIDTKDGVPVVEVEVMTAGGAWVKKNYGTDFTANANTGAVTFVTEPGPSPITGEDNVKITAARTVDGYADRVNHCDIGILFGVGGNADRLFLSGNTDTVSGEDGDTCYRNYDWYSGQDDPTYWPDTGYATVGASNSAIMAYCIINNYLAAIKDDFEPERNIVVREGDLVDSEPAFPIVNTMQGKGCCGKWTAAYLNTEPLFLTELGVYAVTTSDVSGDRYSQNRSYYLDGKLRDEGGKADAYAFVNNDMYWLCINGVAYILDGLQPLLTEGRAPYSTRQYAGFYRTNLPARVMWEEDGVLCFGSEDGVTYRFYEEPDEPRSYSDDGKPVEAYWTTPFIFGHSFAKNKDFRTLSVLLNAEPVTSVAMYEMRGKQKVLLRDAPMAGRFLRWSSTVWDKWEWSGDDSPRVVLSRKAIHKVSKVQFRFENAEQEPFGLLQIVSEYTIGDNYKR